MELEDFQLALEDQGIDSRESGKSLAVEFCPACDRRKYKVIFRVVDVDEDEPFFGRCQSGSCKQNYSSISYLLKVGMPRDEVFELHGKDPYAALEKLAPTPFDDIKATVKEKKTRDKTPVDNDITGFFDVETVSFHPAAKYAIRRGYSQKLNNIVKIDMKTGAVVFVCRDKDSGVLGYQKRFATVAEDGLKTKTSDGFQVSDNVLRFQNEGPIVIAEGPFTALSAWHWGFDSFSTFGSGVGDKQLELIENIHKETGKDILIAREPDDAGRKYWEKISNYFSWREISVKVILPEVGDDLNDSWAAGKKYVISDGEYVNPAIPNVMGFFV